MSKFKIMYSSPYYYLYNVYGIVILKDPDIKVLYERIKKEEEL